MLTSRRFNQVNLQPSSLLLPCIILVMSSMLAVPVSAEPIDCSNIISVYTDVLEWATAVGGKFDTNNFNNIPNELNPNGDIVQYYDLQRTFDFGTDEFSLTTYAESTNPGNIAGISYNNYITSGSAKNFQHDIDQTDFFIIIIKEWIRIK